jgi:ribonuclease HI
MQKKKVIIFSDGGARNNPGPGAGGSVVFFEESQKMLAEGNYYGKLTNNQAEYRALLDALNIVLQYYKNEDAGDIEVEIYLDSELMVKQLKGEYKVRNEGLAEYYLKLQKILSKFGAISVNHVMRANNKLADSLVNAVLDRWQEK